MNPNCVIESIPNFSEGRRPEVISEIVNGVRSVEGVKVLDFSSDSDHNRTVLTIAGNPGALRGAIMKLFEGASKHIDLRVHKGEHPRMGAVDVVPFVPIRDCTMADCVELSKEVAREVSERYSVPVILYEDSCSSENRRNLADVRKGEFEGMATKLAKAEWKPDFGDPHPHPSMGVVAIGARMALVAFNVNLDTANMKIANDIAKAVRNSSGGLRFVKALGVELKERNQVQISMNLVNYKKTPIYRAFELIRIEAKRYGVNIVGSEIVGLVPGEAIAESFAYYVGLENYDLNQILENRL
ncbi:MAG: glutamate formimidoyltransferase [Candidatus Brocadiia bacterium]